MTSDNLIRARDLRKSYATATSSQQVLSGIDLDIAHEEFVVLVRGAA